jgi:SAM-dependent methyltransferase
MDRRQKYLSEFYPEAFFGGFSGVDGTIAFYTRVNALLGADSVVVDYGCGRGAYGDDPVAYRRSLRILRGKAQCVIGLDVNPEAVSNPYIDQFLRLEGDGWPLADGNADLIVCDNVLEHLADPALFFSEARRVLVSGGCLCLRTPNAWSYIALLSRIIPNRAHAPLLARVKKGLEEKDVFPTLYRCNSLPAIRKMLSRFDFKGTVSGYEAEPSYLAFSKIAYTLGVMHQRLAPGFLRPAIFAFAKKQ